LNTAHRSSAGRTNLAADRAGHSVERIQRNIRPSSVVHGDARIGIAATRIPVPVAGPRGEDPCGPLDASSVSWLVPRVFSRGQAISVGLTSTGLRATAMPMRAFVPAVLSAVANTGRTYLAADRRWASTPWESGRVGGTLTVRTGSPRGDSSAS
jgi:hypothetical protein